MWHEDTGRSEADGVIPSMDVTKCCMMYAPGYALAAAWPLLCHVVHPLRWGRGGASGVEAHSMLGATRQCLRVLTVHLLPGSGHICSCCGGHFVMAPSRAPPPVLL